MKRKKIVKDNISDKTVIQAAAKKPNLGINIKFNATLKVSITTDKIKTCFKYFSVDNINCTPGADINIKGNDKERIFMAFIAGK